MRRDRVSVKAWLRLVVPNCLQLFGIVQTWRERIRQESQSFGIKQHWSECFIVRERAGHGKAYLTGEDTLRGIISEPRPRCTTMVSSKRRNMIHGTMIGLEPSTLALDRLKAFRRWRISSDLENYRLQPCWHSKVHGSLALSSSKTLEKKTKTRTRAAAPSQKGKINGAKQFFRKGTSTNNKTRRQSSSFLTNIPAAKSSHFGGLLAR